MTLLTFLRGFQLWASLSDLMFSNSLKILSLLSDHDTDFDCWPVVLIWAAQRSCSFHLLHCYSPCQTSAEVWPLVLYLVRSQVNEERIGDPHTWSAHHLPSLPNYHRDKRLASLSIHSLGLNFSSQPPFLLKPRLVIYFNSITCVSRCSFGEILEWGQSRDYGTPCIWFRPCNHKKVFRLKAWAALVPSAVCQL